MKRRDRQKEQWLYKKWVKRVAKVANQRNVAKDLKEKQESARGEVHIYI